MRTLFKKLSVSFLFAVGTLLCSPFDVQAESITWGQSISGEIGDSREVTYDFNLPTSGNVSFTYTYNDHSNNRFIIQDSAGKDMLYLQVNGTGTYSNSLNLLAGDYKLIIKQYMGVKPELKYSVVPTFTPSNENISESYSNLNNDVASATDYVIEQDMKAQLATNDNQDVYKLNLIQSSFVDFTIESALKSINLDIINDMGDVKYTESNVGTGKHTYSYFFPEGTYYITFSGQETGNYSFKAISNAIPTVNIKKVTNIKTKSAKVTWKRSAKIDGYMIQYSTNRNFKKSKKTLKIESATKSSGKISKLKKNKKYYVRIRTYVKAMDGNTYYSAWGKSKHVTIKK